MSPRARLASSAFVAVGLLTLSACGGSDGGDVSTSDEASAAACRGLAVVDASLHAIEASTRNDTYQNEDSATLSGAVTQIVRIVSSPDVSNELAAPVAALAGAYGAMGHAVEIGLTDGFTQVVSADRTAWTKVASACKPYVDLGA